MAFQFSVGLRNALLNGIETYIGTSPIIKARTSTVPANCAAADSGTVLATVTLPSDWFAAASSGVINKTNTWQDPSADATGTVGHYRMYDSGGVTCVMQWSASDVTHAPSTSVTAGQVFTFPTFAMTAPHA